MHRARARARPARAGARRLPVGGRHGDRSAAAREPAPRGQRPHARRRRAPALDRDARRSDRRARARPRDGARHARGAVANVGLVPRDLAHAAGARGALGVVSAHKEIEDDDKRGALDRALLWRLIRFARPHARAFALSFGVLAVVFALELAGPRLLRGAIDGPVGDAIAARAADPAGFDPKPHVRSLWWWAGAYLAVTAFGFLFRYFEVAQLTRAGQLVVHDLRRQLYGHIQRLDVAWFDRRPTGGLVTRVTSDVDSLSEMFTTGLVTLSFDLVKIAVLLVVLFWLDWRLALIVVALTPVLIGISMVFRGGAREAHRLVRRRLSEMNGYLQEALQGIRVVQMFGREKLVSERFAGHLDRYLKANVRTIFLFALFFPAIDWVVTLIQATSVRLGGARIAEGELSYGLFLQFWFYLAMLLDPIRELGERYNVLQSAFAAAERIFGILDTKPTLRATELAHEPAGALAHEPAGVLARDAAPPRALEGPGHVRFERVSFAYPSGPEVLSDVDFEIPPGRTVALVGATGAGKSTIVNLLLGFYEPTRGRILIDGVDLRELDPRAWRTRLGLVLQEDFLFAGTVRENLVLEREHVTPAALERALIGSCSDELVAKLPGGLDAPVAERGATLSTGERELLAMARALAGAPRLVVFDEATSSVDSATEARIEAATRSLLEHRSALVVAHRLSTIRRAHEILVLHRGQLRERGTHATLLAMGGLYAKLHAMQFHDEPPVSVPQAPASPIASPTASPTAR
ncbi:MAG: ABC transporter ATP-binding protein [Planctomycetota bacterium]|nr:MAG: ABC transporter ATP-binding protein [Planctomycetota bacterium]